MDKKEYLETVIGQIRYKKAQNMISDELENHIDDQKEKFVSDGMNEKEAYDRAVLEMGDPIDVGIAFDQVHRPKIEWKMIVLVFILSIIGLIIQFVMHIDMGTESYRYRFDEQVFYVGIGFIVMIILCFFDYTRICFFAKAGAFLMITLLLLSMAIGPILNGQSGYLSFLGIRVSMHMLIYMYIPFFGGILYSYKNDRNRGFIKSILWMIIPVSLSLRLPNLSLASALLMIMFIQIGFVMKKGWFGYSKKRMAVVAAFLVGYPLFMTFYFLFFGAAYQRERVLAVFSPFTASTEYNYQMNTARNLLMRSKILGKSTNGVGGLLPENDYILTFVLSYYGILAAVLLIFILGFFLFKVFKISLHQKNQLGLAIGIGCSLVFAVQILMYVLVNLTIMPTTSVFLPLFSYGGTGTIVSYALIGILLSIYRYQNLIPVNPASTSIFKNAKQLAQNL